MCTGGNTQLRTLITWAAYSWQHLNHQGTLQLCQDLAGKTDLVRQERAMTIKRKRERERERVSVCVQMCVTCWDIEPCNLLWPAFHFRKESSLQMLVRIKWAGEDAFIIWQGTTRRPTSSLFQRVPRFNHILLRFTIYCKYKTIYKYDYILKATFPYSENLRIPCFHRTPDLGFGMLLW